MLGTDEMRAWYGTDHVLLAADRGAVGTLLISDELFRWEQCSLSFDIAECLLEQANPMSAKGMSDLWRQYRIKEERS